MKKKINRYGQYILVALFLMMGAVCARANVHEEEIVTRMQTVTNHVNFKDKALKQRVDSLSKSKISAYGLLNVEFQLNNYLAQNNENDGIVTLSLFTLPRMVDELGSDKDVIRMYIYILNQLCGSAKQLGMYNLIFNYYLKGYEIAKRNDMKEEMAILQNNMSSMYTEIKDYDKAIGALKEAITINENLKIKDRLFVNYNNMSAAYAYKDNYDKALEYAFLALHQLPVPSKDRTMEMLMKRNISSIYSKKGLPQVGLDNMQAVVAYQEENKQYVYLGDTYRVLGSLYKSLGDEAKATESFAKSLSYSTRYGQTSQQVEAYKLMSDAYAQVGDYMNAYKMFKRHTELKDSLSRAESNNHVNMLLELYSLEQGQYAASKADREASRRSAKAWMVMALVAVGLVLVMAYLLRRGKVKANEAADEKCRDAVEKAIRENNVNGDKVKELESTIATITNEKDLYQSKILSLSLQQQYNQDFYDQLSENLKQVLLQVNPKSTAARNEIKSTLDLLNQYKINNELNIFNEVFEQIHPRFFENLSKEYDLTPKELKLCAMLRLGFSTKSIANITFREIRSVESARNRLRKKFELQQQDDLMSFLMRF